MKLISTLLASLALYVTSTTLHQPPQDKPLELGNFSVSLAVEDIAASYEFYGKLGFTKIGGDIEQNWLVLRNGPARIGLFQGMFPKNVLTFNPGWDTDAEALEEFQDVRAIQAELKKRGIELTTEVEAGTTGPAHFTLIDPDGNPILVDQHV
jgi:catechol 2,3-dioxygenase-like lactoylglutathione lyase family enzyme